MTGRELAQARETLGRLWGMGRAVRASEMTGVLLTQRALVARWEKQADRPIPRHYAIVVTMMLDGARPRGLEDELGL